MLYNDCASNYPAYYSFYKYLSLEIRGKNSQKCALLPIVTKFGTQEVDRLSHLPFSSWPGICSSQHFFENDKTEKWLAMWEKFTMLLVIKKCFSTVDTFCNSFGCHLVYQLLNNLKNWGHRAKDQWKSPASQFTEESCYSHMFLNVMRCVSVMLLIPKSMLVPEFKLVGH